MEALMRNHLLAVAVLGAALVFAASAAGAVQPLRQPNSPTTIATAAANVQAQAAVLNRSSRMSRRWLRIGRAELPGMNPGARPVARAGVSGRLAGAPPLCDGRRATLIGTDGNDVLTGTPGRDVIAALGGNDEIHAQGQDDVVCGGPGDDVIWGDGGNDRLFGEGGQDLIDAGAGNDYSEGGSGDRDGATFWDSSHPISASLVSGTATGDGSDSFVSMEGLHGSEYGDTFLGDSGPNEFFGLGGNDSISAGNGDDTVSGGEGNDVIDGGGGQSDSVWFYAATGPVSASLVTGTSTGQGSDTFANIESLRGGPYSDTLMGNSGDNFIWGDRGDDTLSGGAGESDFLVGGPGNDTIDGGPGNNDVAGYFDATGPVAASLASGTSTGEGSDSFTNVEQLHGGPYNDVFTGDVGDNGFFGLGGDDAISAEGGNDNVVGGDGNDTLDGGAGEADTVGFWSATGGVTVNLGTGTSSGQGNDTLQSFEWVQGTMYADTITGDGGANLLFGHEGDDSLAGGDGNDLLAPGPGTDTLDGGPGDSDAAGYWDAGGPITASLATNSASGEGADTYANIEQIHGSAYADNLSGGSGDAWILGNDGNDVVNGGSGNDFLFGNGGDDNINGGAGDDFLAPGSGTDSLNGGDGSDKAAYWDAPGSITASLATASAIGDGTDTFANLEGIHGGNFGDTLYGDEAGNELFGNDGPDTLYGAGGDDILNGWNGDDGLYGGAGNDYIDGWDGFDFADGGHDSDYCVNVESSVNCEGP
jgi:Ca2+-binding RTX toxin-like protein